ncbi:MAG: sortase, partial [Anaerolineales bacterium]|nr:sortase [Anaerolineales bacterium]
EIILYVHGLKYTYQVRFMELVAADDYSILQHKDQDWLTLFTCKEYSDLIGGYLWRQAVQAVLIDVEQID